MFGMNTNSALRDGVVGVSLKGGGGLQSRECREGSRIVWNMGWFTLVMG